MGRLTKTRKRMALKISLRAVLLGMWSNDCSGSKATHRKSHLLFRQVTWKKNEQRREIPPWQYDLCTQEVPFGTLLKVRNPLNGKEVVVRVTDRGPFSKRYVIDLSKAAARELGFIRKGFCQVEITRIHPNRIPFRPEDAEEIPELHLEYQDIVTYPVPIWQQDTLQDKKPQPTRIKKLKIDKK